MEHPLQREGFSIQESTLGWFVGLLQLDGASPGFSPVGSRSIEERGRTVEPHARAQLAVDQPMTWDCGDTQLFLATWASAAWERVGRSGLPVVVSGEEGRPEVGPEAWKRPEEVLHENAPLVIYVKCCSMSSSAAPCLSTRLRRSGGMYIQQSVYQKQVRPSSLLAWCSHTGPTSRRATRLLHMSSSLAHRRGDMYHYEICCTQTQIDWLTLREVFSGRRRGHPRLERRGPEAFSGVLVGIFPN